VREAERDNVFNQYREKKGELISGIVRRFERGSIIVDLGGAEAVLPVREQVPRESFRAGDRIVAYVVDIDKAARGPQIIISRGHKGLLEKLFEMEVPEIYGQDRAVEASAREPVPARRSRSAHAIATWIQWARAWHEGLARAGGGAGIARREDRHRALRQRPGSFRVQRHRAGPGFARDDRRLQQPWSWWCRRQASLAIARRAERAPRFTTHQLAH